MKGLQCKMVSGKELVTLEKKLWYEANRNRLYTMLNKISDKELEQGIKEFEEKFKG